MELTFWQAISHFFHKKCHSPPVNDKRSAYIFYKIVDAAESDGQYLLQCINTSITFHVGIAEMVSDRKTLSSFHPVQACYIGIEYSKYLQNHHHQKSSGKHTQLKTEAYLLCRYGLYQIVYEDRVGNIGFIDKSTKESRVMDPRDIALSRELIEEFDAVQAFYIGYLAGLKLRNAAEKPMTKAALPAYLKIVK